MSREFHVVWPRNQECVKVSVPFQMYKSNDNNNRIDMGVL